MENMNITAVGEKISESTGLPEELAETDIPKLVDELIVRHHRLLISILEEVQEHYNYLPEEILRELSKKLKISLRDIYGVATFYNAFSFKPKGKYVVTVCLGTACHVRGGVKICDALSRELNIQPGETTPDKFFTLEAVNCLGCCALGPVVVVNGKYHGKMNVNKSLSLIRSHKKKEVGK